MMKKRKKTETEACRNERQSVEKRNQNKEFLQSGFKDQTVPTARSARFSLLLRCAP